MIVRKPTLTRYKSNTRSCMINPRFHRLAARALNARPLLALSTVREGGTKGIQLVRGLRDVRYEITALAD